jgi:hypothetical protein
MHDSAYREDKDRGAASGPGRPRNRCDRMAWAGAFGDLGTLVPFLVAYMCLVRPGAHGVPLALGLSCIRVSLEYRAPIAVQPMKASGTVAITRASGGPRGAPCPARVICGPRSLTFPGKDPPP